MTYMTDMRFFTKVDTTRCGVVGFGFIIPG